MYTLMLYENDEGIPMSEKDTDLAQLSDMDEFNNQTQHTRRATDMGATVADAHHIEQRQRLFFLERRVERHRDELNVHMERIEELKTMVKRNGEEVAKNSEDTSEILEIVTTAKSFFKGLGWITDKIQTIMAIVGVVAAIVGYFKFKG